MQTEPLMGVAYHMPDPEYRKHEGISQSSMKELLISPAHFQARYGPNADPFFPSTSMIEGTAIHARVLEPEKFDNLFYDRSSKPKDKTVAEVKEMLDEAQIEYPKAAKKAELEALLWPEGKKKDNRTSLDPEAFKRVHGAADALRAHDITGLWFDPGAPDYRKFNEVSIFAKNHAGQLLKGRFDRLRVDDANKVVEILDLKTTVSANFKDFQRSVANFSYDLQAAWYSWLAMQAWPGYNIQFLFVAIERKAPYGISVFRASEQLLQSGQRKMAKALDLFEQCRTLDYWPSYEPIIHDLALPGWAIEKEVDLEF